MRAQRAVTIRGGPVQQRSRQQGAPVLGEPAAAQDVRVSPLLRGVLPELRHDVLDQHGVPLNP